MTNNKKNWKIYIPLTLVLIIVIIAGVFWYKDYSSYIKTDDAYVASDVISVSPKILGRISHVYFEEGDSVKEGELLAEIDSTDLLAQKQQILATKAQSIAGKSQTEASYSLSKKNIVIAQIGLDKSKEDFERAKLQFNAGVITKEQFDHLKKGLETSQAQLEAAKAQVDVSKSLINSADAAVNSANAQIGVINTQLRNTKLFAPITGVVAKRWLLAGDIVQPGQSIFTINNERKLWIQIFLEETNLESLSIGQQVKFTLDAYPNEVFTGKIFTLASTTASQFSLIPPSNASGNFTKITQRVGIKISIDGTESGKKLSDYKLLTGMSAVVKIIKK